MAGCCLKVVELVILRGLNNKELSLSGFNVYLEPEPNIIEVTQIWEEIINAIGEKLIPAYQDLIQFLSTKCSSSSRFSWALTFQVAQALRRICSQYTTLDDLGAAEIHELGLQEVENPSEMREIQTKLGIEGD